MKQTFSSRISPAAWHGLHAHKDVGSGHKIWYPGTVLEPTCFKAVCGDVTKKSPVFSVSHLIPVSTDTDPVCGAFWMSMALYDSAFTHRLLLSLSGPRGASPLGRKREALANENMTS